MSDEDRAKLVSTEQSLHMPTEPKIPAAMSGLENFSLSEDENKSSDQAVIDADSLFNLPDVEDE